MKITYLILCILGFVLPYSQFIPFLLENGLDIKLFFLELFAKRISSFFAIDLFVSSLVFWTFLFWEGSRLKMRFLWIYVVFNLAIGVSFTLPLFLLMHSRQIEKQTAN